MRLENIGTILYELATAGYLSGSSDTDIAIDKVKSQILKLMEECVPEEMKALEVIDYTDKQTFIREGFNQCRSQTLSNIREVCGEGK